MAEASSLVEAFNDQRGIYEAFTGNAHTLIETLLKQKGIEAFRIESRTKSNDSFSEKLARDDKKGKYKVIGQMTDISGIRIINYLEQECEDVLSLIRDNFEIDESNSIDKSQELDLDRFGYQSTHLVVSYPENRVSLEEFKPFAGLKAEVQIKTLLQHAWASIDWKMRYKSSLEAPKGLRRRLYRISALLEAADDEFSFVSRETLRIRKEYEDAIERGDLAVGIDRESVEAFIAAESQIQLVRDLTAPLAPPQFEWSLVPVTEASSRGLVTTINQLGITSLDVLKMKLDERREKLPDAAGRVERIWTAWTSKKSTSNNADIIKLALLLDQSKKDLIRILESCPFAPEFQKALLDTAP